MSKHTPGPWTHDETWGLIMDKDRAEVAAVHAGRAGTKEETDANARLIAAAPELLAVMRDVSALLPVAPSLHPQDISDLQSRVVDAIAKAEGGA